MRTVALHDRGAVCPNPFPYPSSIGLARYKLARAARRAWTSIGFDHLVRQYLAPFDCPEE